MQVLVVSSYVADHIKDFGKRLGATVGSIGHKTVFAGEPYIICEVIKDLASQEKISHIEAKFEQTDTLELMKGVKTDA